MRHRMSRLVSLTLAVILAFAGRSAAGESKVADAAEQRSKTAVLALVKQGADVNAPQGDGATALHWAAHWNDVSMATDLLRAGANPNAVNDYGVTPLFLAATNGSAPMISVLLKNAANPNAALPTGETVLMTAARSGNVAAVETLIEAGAALEATHATKGQTALMWAIAEHHPDVARVLIDRGANFKARTAGGFTPMLFATREGDAETVRLLLAKGIDVNESAPDGMTPLLMATVWGHVDLALSFLQQGARPDGNAALAGYTPLHWAVTTLEINPFTYPDREAPGEWAALGGIPDRAAKLHLIKTLLARGADVNARMTKRIAPRPVHINASSPGPGFTPFLAAAASADAEIMRLLLANGADPTIRASAATPLMTAISATKDIGVVLTEAKRLEVVRLAWQLGEDLEAQDAGGNRAMHLAARYGYHDVITFLVKHGADLNPRNKPRAEGPYGGERFEIAAQTPLGLVEGTAYGLYYERPETAEFLRKLGAKSEGRYIHSQDNYKAGTSRGGLKGVLMEREQEQRQEHQHPQEPQQERNK